MRVIVFLTVLVAVGAIESTPEGINGAVQDLTSAIADQTSRVSALDSALYSLATKQEAAQLDSTLQAIALTQQNALTTSEVTTVQNQVSQQFSQVNDALAQATSAEKLTSKSAKFPEDVLTDVTSGNNDVTMHRNQLVMNTDQRRTAAADSLAAASKGLVDDYDDFAASSIQDAVDRLDEIMEMLGGDELDFEAIFDAMSKYPGYSASTHAVTYRWKRFATGVYYSGCSSCWYWMMGNNDDSFGGSSYLNPSDWSSYPYAHEFHYGGMSNIKSLFTETAHGSSNLNAVAFTERTNSANNYQARSFIALFRIKNTSSNNISHRFRIYFTNYGSYALAFSIALDKSSVYSYTGNCYICDTTVTVTFPANKVSNLFFSSQHGPWNSYKLANNLGFFDNSMNLPQGLQFVNDLDAATTI